MKNIKKMLALVAVFVLALAGVLSLVACVKTHECGHVCETCGKCTDANCAETACAEKCAGHTPVVEPHVCGHVCATCGKCTDAACTNDVCKDKCLGHTPAPHVCGHVCATCGKCTDAACADAVCADKCAGHDDPTPEHVCKHVCATCNKCTSDCADPACSDKCECAGYTITLVVGDGALEAGTSLTYKTGADGKLTSMLPEPEATAAHWQFDNWYDAATGGNAIDETEKVFDADATIYARYIREDGVWVGDVFKAALSVNGGNKDREEYWLGGTKITLAKDDVMSLYLDGNVIRHHVEPNSAGITKPASGTQVTEVTVAVAGPFEIYLHKNASDWSCEYSGPTEVIVGSDIPEGCDAIKVNIGTNSVTFYLKDSAGKAVGAADFSKFCIYTYQDEIFGDWGTSATKGVLSANMIGTGAAVPNGWIFRWGSGYTQQTANIIGVFKNGGTYVVELPANTNGEAKITEIAMTKNTVTLDLNYVGQPEEKATVEAVAGKLSALPTEPTRDDYDFVGWFTAAVDGEQVTVNTEYTEDTTIYARWTAKIEVTVSYNYTGCTDPVIVKADKGKLSALPTAPARDGYYLVGWFTEAEDGTKITLDTVFDEDTTIYAQWGVRVDATVTVNYNYEGCADPETIEISAANGNLIIPFPVAPVREGYEFLGWYTTAEDTEGAQGDLVTAETEIHEDTTIYARYAVVHTVTLVVGEDGSLPEGAATTYKVLDGKIQLPQGATGLPAVTVSKAHWQFLGWYDGTTAVDVATKVFDKDTTLTAKITREDGVWIGDTFKNALTRNTGNTTRTEYWLGGAKIVLAKGDVIVLYMNGIVVNHFVEPASAGIVKPAESAVVGSVTVDVAGEFAIYLHRNTSDWSCEYSGPTEVNTASEAPYGCDIFTVTMGSNKISFFLKDSSGNPVSKADFSKFCIYTYEAEIFGNWAGSTTNGKLKEEMSGGTAVPNGWIFRWGSGYNSQTANIIGAFKAGKTYLVELPAANKGTAKVTELNITSIYTITLDQNFDGQPATKLTAKAYNGKLNYLPSFVREGFEDKDLFWYTAAEGGERVTLNTVFTADTTIYARWSDKLVITPNYNYPECAVADGITINQCKFTTLPVAPARDGYDFMGWYDAAIDGNAITTDTEFSANASIYAHWRECIVITVDLNYDEQPETKATVTIKDGKFTSVNLPAKPERAGYEFLGWFTDATESDRVTTSTVFEADATIYAHWRVPFVVTFNLNYEECDPATTKTANVVDGQTYSRLVAADITTPERTGYDFLGWYEVSEVTGGTKLTTTTNITENVTYYARWREYVVVTFALNYTDCAANTTETATLQAGTVNSRLTAAQIATPVRDGYDFLGWYPNADGTGTKLSTTTNLIANVTYYASWRLPIVVTFNLNYTACAEPTTATATLVTGQTYSRLASLPVPDARADYDFLGWYTVAATSGGSQLTTTTNLTANVTYYARWRAKRVVTFDLNYVGQPETKATVKADVYPSSPTYSRLSSLPEAPVRDGYEFVGWYSTSAATGGTLLSTTTNLSANVTYYARWKALPVVTFDVNDGAEHETDATLTVNAEKKLAAFIDEPTRDGYTFAGWFTAAEEGEAVTLDKVYAADTTIYAHWTAVAETPDAPEVED